jgi:formylmethanofuran dehydrogenase subunit E
LSEATVQEPDMDLEKVNDVRLKEQLRKVIEFDGYLSAGAAIGVFMLNYACEILRCQLEDDIFVTAETTKCLPDAATALANCTIGNKRLCIVDYGKMALSMTKRDDPNGIRIILDPKKTLKYPVIHAWYLNEREVAHREVMNEILKAGRDILSFEYVRIAIPQKEKKGVVFCVECREPFIPEKSEEKCKYCFGDRYYEVR